MDPEEAKKLLAEMKDGITAEVSAKLEKQMLDLKEATKTDAVKDVEAKTKAVDFIKDKYNQDIKGIAMKADTTVPDHNRSDNDDLVPEYFASEIIRIAGQYGVARRNARVVNMPGATLRYPTIGSLTAYRIDEKGKATVSNATTDNVLLTAKKVVAMAIVSKELIEDANIDTLGELAGLGAEAVAKLEDQWAFAGLTTGEGILQNATVPVYTLTNGHITYKSCTFDDLSGGLDLVNDAVVDQLVWVGSFSFFNGMRTVKDPTTGMYVFQNPGNNMPRTVWDRPYFLSTVMPKTTETVQANKPFLAAYDPRYLFIGDRRQISVEFSKEATITSSTGATAVNLFEQDMVAMKITERIDIQLAQPDQAFVRFETAAS
jgi:HK97 family phage major capsid protein